MKTIFYNAKIFALDNENQTFDAMLINDESIYFLGSNDEVLKFKDSETECVDLEDKFVIPSFFGTNLQIFNRIDKKLKNANLIQNFRNSSEKDEDFEIFENFELYKEEFLKQQTLLLKQGFSTILEFDLNKDAFVFFKKLAKENLLCINVIGFVDIKSSKDVMDNNCRTFQKYQNNFRIGGYSLSLDGEVYDKRAWIKSPYKREKNYNGSCKITEEHLSFLLKTVKEERKQIFINAHGELAVQMLLQAFAKNVKEEDSESLHYITIKNCGFVTKSQIAQLKKYNIGLGFNLGKLVKFVQKIKGAVGLIRYKKFMPINKIKNAGIDYFVYSDEFDELSPMAMLSFYDKNDSKTLQKFKKNNQQSSIEVFKNCNLGLARMINEESKKGSLEIGKQANFLVLSETNLDFDKFDFGNAKILKHFICGKDRLL